MDIDVIKKSGSLEKYDFEKIVNAVTKSAKRVRKEPSPTFWKQLKAMVESGIPPKAKVTVEFLHRLVQASLYELDIELYREYKGYRDYKIRFNKMFQDILLRSDNVLFNGDKENANKDSTLISTKKALVGEIVSEMLALEYEIPREVAEAHKNGGIYYHDLRDYIYGSINCCLFDTGTFLKNGFTNNGIEHNEPNRISTALSILGNMILCASSQQFGGFTLPEIDTVLAPYVEDTFNEYADLAAEYRIPNCYEYAMDMTERDLYQAYESLEYMINTTNNALSQTPFTTMTFGLDTSKWGRMVTKTILKVRKKGLGKKHITAIFPKLVFLCRKEINRKKDSLNYDLYRQAIDCSLSRIYPDYLSLDEGYLAEMYEKYGKVVSPMGCRAYLSPWYEGGGMSPIDDKDKPIFIGRANCGAISIILPHLALESGGDIREFYNLLDKYMELVKEAHIYKFNKLKNIPALSNPLFFCEGGCHIKLEPTERIERVIRTFTWSFGYIGLDEVTRYFRGVGIDKDNSLAIEILQYMSNKLDKYKKETGLLFALYGTPAEGLCGKALRKDREMFGVVEGVTDKNYYTNSYHENVGIGESAFKKQETESPMFHISSGGRIVYNEFPRTDNIDAIEEYINHAMDLGLYYGVNFELSSCSDCGETGEFDTCPACGSSNVLVINRVCGYLGIYKDGDITRYNEGKRAEVIERKDNVKIK